MDFVQVAKSIFFNISKNREKPRKIGLFITKLLKKVYEKGCFIPKIILKLLHKWYKVVESGLKR